MTFVTWSEFLLAKSRGAPDGTFVLEATLIRSDTVPREFGPGTLCLCRDPLLNLTSPFGLPPRQTPDAS